MTEELVCGCCRIPLDRPGVGGWIGVVELQPICLGCYRYFHALRWNFPDRALDELLDSVRLLRAIEEMSLEQRRQLQKLIFLRRNRSRRADRLIEMAVREQISLAQLLSAL